MRKGVVFLGALILILILLAIRVHAAEPQKYTELELMERVVEAEAGNQGMVGKRLVAAVIYNRVESEKFPNTVYDVLVSPHQFSTVWNGAVDRIEVSGETKLAVMLEVTNRTDNEILYFNCGECSGKFAYKYKGHNFGK